MSIRKALTQNYTRHIDPIVIGKAKRTVLHWLDLDVPKSAGRAKAGHVRLKNTRQVTDRSNQSSVSITIKYPTKIANYTDEGTRAHIIRARRAGGRLRFTVNGQTLYRRQVKWKPGPGVRRNKRWFTKNTNRNAWRNAIHQAIR